MPGSTAAATNAERQRRKDERGDEFVRKRYGVSRVPHLATMPSVTCRTQFILIQGFKELNASDLNS